MNVEVFGHCYGTDGSPQEHFKKKGIQNFHQLQGSWALRIDNDSETHLVTDRWGTRPLFYTVCNNKLLVAEHPDELLQGLGNTFLNDRAMVRFLLQDFSHEDETLLTAIKKVPAGQTLTWRRGRLESKRWAEDANIRGESLDFKTASFQWGEALRRNLYHLLPQKKTWGLFLSGGLDSSGLVGLCQHLIHENNWPTQMRLYNVDSHHIETHDSGFCNQLATTFDLPLYRATISEHNLVDLFHANWNTKSLVPFFPTLHMFEPLIRKAHEDGCDGLLFGYGADEQWTFPLSTLCLDLFLQKKSNLFFKSLPKNPRLLLKTAKEMLGLFAIHQCPNVLKKTLGLLIQRHLPTHLSRDPLILEELHRLSLRIQAARPQWKTYTQRQFLLRNLISGNNPHNLICHLGLAQQYGLPVYFPYLCPELLDISFSSSVETMITAQDKNILRQILRDHLPEPIRTAPKFQDYSHLAYKTALLLIKESQDYSLKHDWLQKKMARPPTAAFDDDSLFEAVYIEKLLTHFEGPPHESFVGKEGRKKNIHEAHS